MATSKTSTRGLRVWAAITALVLQGATFAAAAGNTDPRVDYDKRIKASQNIGVLGKDVAGDRVNFFSGATSFAAQDLSIPGNSTLPVAVGRSYQVEFDHMLAEIYGSPSERVVRTVRQYAFGDWDLDIPYLTARFHQSEGWQIDSTTPANRCSVLGQVKANGLPADGHPKLPPGPQAGAGGSPFQGYTLHVDGQDQSMLMASIAGVSKPSAGGPYHWLTKDNWWFSCLPAIANGAGEGFMAISPDGTRYRFDWMSRRNVTHLENEVSIDPEDGGHVKVFYTYAADVFLLPTRIEDRFGNYVTYAYSNDGYARLQSVTGNDGRQLTLGYNPQGFVSTLSDGTHTVNYEYNGNSLRRVVLPDGSAWQYSLADVSALAPVEGGGCGSDPDIGPAFWCQQEPPIVPGGTPTGYVIHPAGARVDFAFNTRFHFSGDDLLHGYPLGISQKTISGAGLPAQTWRYAFGLNRRQFWEQCLATQNCPNRTWTDEISPDYAITRRMFGLVPLQDQTMLLQELQGVIPTTTNTSTIPANPYARINSSLRGNDIDIVDDAPSPTVITTIVTGPPQFYGETDYTYATGAQAVRVGVNPLFSAGNPSQVYASEHYVPTTQRKVHRDGVAFTWQANSFDAFANPTNVTRSSTLGYSRTDTTVYHHNTAKWVIGQVTSSTNTNTGLVESQTSYWPDTALPQHTWAFGKLQQTLFYYTDGTLVSVTDGNNRTTSFANWKRGIPGKITFADSTFKSAYINDNGWIKWVKDENGFQTSYGYDAMGRVNLIDYPDGDDVNWNNTIITFAPAGATGYGLPAGHWRRTESTGTAQKITYFDALWRPVLQEVYDSGNTWNTITQSITRYDSDGRATFVSYPQRSVDPAVYATWANPAVAPNALGTWNSYDALGRPTLVQQNSELGLLNTSYEYLTGFQTRVTNPRGYGVTTSYKTYDQPSTDWPISVLHSTWLRKTDITRDVFGKPTVLVQGGDQDGAWVSQSRSYAYNAQQELCRTVEPETGATLLGYDAAGNLKWSSAGLAATTACEANGSTPTVAARRVDRSYDTRNRLSTLTFPDGLGDQAWTYAADGLPSQVTAYNDLGHTGPVITAYSYNKRRLLNGQGEALTRPNWYSWGIGYGYDANGNLASHAYPAGLTVTYLPNALGQPTQVGAFATGVSYYPNGAMKQFTYGNGLVHTLSQNARGLPDTSCDFIKNRGQSTFSDKHKNRGQSTF